MSDHLVAHGSDEGACFVYDITDDYNLIQTLTEPGPQCRTMGFHTGIDVLAVGESHGSDHVVYIYDTGTWDVIDTIGDADQVRRLKFSRDGEYLMIGDIGDPPVMRLYDVPDTQSGTWDLIHTFTEPDGDVRGMDQSHSGEYIAVSSYDSSVYIYEDDAANDYPFVTELTVESPAEPSCRDVVFSPTDSYIAVGRTYMGDRDEPGECFVHEVGGDWNLEARLDEPDWTGDIMDSRVYGVDWHPTEDYIVYTSTEPAVYVHEVGGTWPLDREIGEATDQIKDLNINPARNLLAYGSDDNNLYVHEVPE